MSSATIPTVDRRLGWAALALAVLCLGRWGLLAAGVGADPRRQGDRGGRPIGQRRQPADVVRVPVGGHRGRDVVEVGVETAEHPAHAVELRGEPEVDDEGSSRTAVVDHVAVEVPGRDDADPDVAQRATHGRTLGPGAGVARLVRSSSSGCGRSQAMRNRMLIGAVGMAAALFLGGCSDDDGGSDGADAGAAARRPPRRQPDRGDGSSRALDQPEKRPQRCCASP